MFVCVSPAGGSVLRPERGGVGRQGADGVLPTGPRLQPRQSRHQVPLRDTLLLHPRGAATNPAVCHRLT